MPNRGYVMHLSPNTRPMSGWLFVRIRRGSDPGNDMPALDASTGFVADDGTSRLRARHATPGRRYRAGDIALTLFILPLLAASLAAAAWSFWILANGALGRRGTILALVALVAGTVAFSRLTGRGLAVSLILVGFGSLILFIGTLFGVAGCALIFGG